MGRGEPTVGSWGCFSGGISLNMNCFVWSILGFFCPSLVAVFPPPKNLFTTWNLISLFNSSDQRPELWFWREQSPWADSMKLLSNQPQPLPGLHLCFSQCWPQCFSPTVWAVSHLSSPSSFKTTHTHSVAIDAGQPVCVWKSICMSDWVKWTLFWGQKNRWTHWAKPKAHTHTHNTFTFICLYPSHTHILRDTGVYAKAAGSVTTSKIEICSGRKLLLHLSMAGWHQRRGWPRGVTTWREKALVGKGRTRGGGIGAAAED